MIYIKIPNFVLINQLEKDHSMLETRCLKNVVIFFSNNFKFCAAKKDYKYLQRYYGTILSTQKYGNITVKGFHKYEKLQYKKNKLKLDIGFLSNCKQLGVYPKFLIFKLPNVSNKDAVSVRERLLRSAINKRNEDLQQISKDLSLSENFLSKQLSTIDFHILTTRNH